MVEDRRRGDEHPPRPRRPSRSTCSPPSATPRRSTSCSTSRSSDDLATRFRVVMDNDGDDEIGELLADKRTLLGLSDAGAHATQLCDACYSTHLLGHWVRERKALSLEDAVWRLTGHPHEAFRIPERGLVQEGFLADLVAFDPDTVGTTPVERVHDQPGGTDRLLVRQHRRRARVGQRRRDTRRRRRGRGVVPGGSCPDPRSRAGRRRAPSGGDLRRKRWRRRSQGVRVVELSLATSAVGAGMAAQPAGQAAARPRRRRHPRHVGAPVDARRRASSSTRAWNHGKEVVEVDDDACRRGRRAARRRRRRAVRHRARAPDRGARDRVRRRSHATTRAWSSCGCGRASTPAGAARPRPARRGAGRACPRRSARHRGGPAFPDLQVGSAGAALAATVGALALLYEREATGVGGWAETSLVDGVFALLPMIIGRVEHMSPTTNLLWRDQGPAEALSYRCADGEYVQLWFGAKGAYEGVPRARRRPAERGGLQRRPHERRDGRARRALVGDVRDPRPRPLARGSRRPRLPLRAGVPPGRGAARRARARGRARGRRDADGITVLGPLSRHRGARRSGAGGRRPADGPTTPPRLLEGVRVLDLSAYLAGPVAPLVLAELGADVVKVEPVTGDVHRNMEPMFAAGQRGKRAVALDLKSPDAPRGARRGCSGGPTSCTTTPASGSPSGSATTKRRCAPRTPTSSTASPAASATTGPARCSRPTTSSCRRCRASRPGRAARGSRRRSSCGARSTSPAGGSSACGILAGLFARRRHGGGQSVRSSLLGAALTLKSGAFLDGDEIVGGPVLDADQRGYGAAYRLYQGADGAWFALAVPDADAWARLRAVDRRSTRCPRRRRRCARRGPRRRCSPRRSSSCSTSRPRTPPPGSRCSRGAEVPVEPVARRRPHRVHRPAPRRPRQPPARPGGHPRRTARAGSSSSRHCRCGSVPRRGPARTGGDPRAGRADRRVPRVARLRRRRTRAASRRPAPSRSGLSLTGQGTSAFSASWRTSSASSAQQPALRDQLVEAARVALDVVVVVAVELRRASRGRTPPRCRPPRTPGVPSSFLRVGEVPARGARPSRGSAPRRGCCRARRARTSRRARPRCARACGGTTPSATQRTRWSSAMLNSS